MGVVGSAFVAGAGWYAREVDRCCWGACGSDGCRVRYSGGGSVAVFHVLDDAFGVVGWSRFLKHASSVREAVVYVCAMTGFDEVHVDLVVKRSR